ncbi:MAG: dTMP kinase [Spirochaetaceae bacterium]|nr:MAG: dTMP kinase [Spirochaetaceae bacterium]
MDLRFPRKSPGPAPVPAPPRGRSAGAASALPAGSPGGFRPQRRTPRGKRGWWSMLKCAGERRFCSSSYTVCYIVSYHTRGGAYTVEDQDRFREVLPGFIVFEGLDGAGTTTQARALADHLGRSGSAEFTFEPTSFATGRVIRTLLKGPEFARWETLALLFAADRNEHLNRPGTGIRARLDAGFTVVSDRYLFSSLAYQGAFADPRFVEQLNASFPLPRHLFFIDTPLDEAHRRIAKRLHMDPEGGDSLEVRSVQSQVAPRYREVIDSFARGPEARAGLMSVHHIDGSRSAEDVFRAILEALRHTVNPSRRSADR